MCRLCCGVGSLMRGRDPLITGSTFDSDLYFAHSITRGAGSNPGCYAASLNFVGCASSSFSIYTIILYSSYCC